MSYQPYAISGPVTDPMYKEILSEELEALEKSRTYTDFVLDPRDSHMLYALSSFHGEQYARGNINNIGKVYGRIRSFPKYSLGLSDDDIISLAKEGIYWVYNKSEMGCLECVGCYFQCKEWDDIREVLHKHDTISTSPNDYYICSLLGAKKLGYQIDVDVVISAHLPTQPFRKPADYTRFVIDPRDYRRMDLERTTAGIHWNGRFANNNYRNVGRSQGRYASFPDHSIDYASDITQLVRSGFYWYKDETWKNPRGVLICVSCRLKIKDWQPGMSAWLEHRKRNPNCEYNFHQEAGCEMDVYTYMYGEKGMMKPWRCRQKHKFCPPAKLPSKLELIPAPSPAPAPAAARISTLPTSCSHVVEVADDNMFIDDENYADYDACLSNAVNFPASDDFVLEYVNSE